MVVVYWKLDHQKQVDGVYQSAETLTTYKDVIINTAIGDSKDSFNFKVDDFNDEFSNEFTLQDRILIYRQVDTDTGWNDDNLLMNGIIREVPQSDKYNQQSIQVKGYNHSETVAQALVFFDSTEDSYTLPQFLDAVILSIANLNSKFKVTWKDTNPTTKKDGNPFPLIKERVFYKSLGSILEKYSSQEHTADGNYYWFVDKNNQVVWNPRQDDASGSFIEAEDEHLELKISRDTKDVKNFIIVKMGFDAKGKPIQTFVPEYNSIAKHGFKFHFLIDENKTSQSIIEADASDAGVDDMSDASYPFTPSWSAESFANFNAYNAGLRDYIKQKAKDLGETFTKLRGNGKLKVDLAFVPETKDWKIGDVINCNIPRISSSEETPLRIASAQYTSTIDTFMLEEDLGSQ